MDSEAVAVAPEVSLYDRDFYEWTQLTAQNIRNGEIAPQELENIAEELESVGRRDAREVNSRMEVIIKHLLKCQFQSEKRTDSWTTTLSVQRTMLSGLFEQSPSLKLKAGDALAQVYRRAVDDAAAEAGLGRKAFPVQCPYTLEQIRKPGFLPFPDDR